MKPTIQPAIRSQCREITALLAAQLAEHSIAVAGQNIARMVEGVFELPSRGAFLVALHEGTAIGIAYLAFTWTIEHGARSAWLEELYVVPQHRGQGIGRDLLGAALEEAGRQGCVAVDLEVEADHQRAENLYRRAGFQAHHRNRFVKKLARPPAER